MFRMMAGIVQPKDMLIFFAGIKRQKLELGVGMNTPGIIKYPFWQMAAQNPNADYVSINAGEAYAPEEIRERAICVNGDIGEVICRCR